MRKRMGIGNNIPAGATQIITEVIEAGLIKHTDDSNESKKFSAYIEP